jgi:GxxExxY protein
MDESNNKDEETYNIIGAAMTVSNKLGCGFLESVYQDALELEFQHQNISYCREQSIAIYYRNIKINSYFKADFICYNSIIVELKALQHLNSKHEAQVLNYLKSTGLDKALLINFGNPKIQYKRMVLNLKE